MDVITRIIQALKLRPSHVAILGVFCGAVVFLPEKVIAALGIGTLHENCRGWFGTGLLFSGGALLVHISIWLYGRFNDFRRLSGWQKQLHALTEEEKDILRRYIVGKTITQKLDPKSGVVAQLVARGIVGRSTELGNILEDWPHNIQPWAWDYLNKNPHLLVCEADPTTSRNGTIHPCR